jgi:hypothetical protein
VTTKRVSYLPTVREVADLPSPSAFEVGVGIYVQADELIYATDGVAWSPAAASGIVGPPGAPGAPGAPGVDAPQFRGLAYRTSSGMISFTGVTVGDFISSGLTGTLDAAVSVGTDAAGTNKFGLKRTASGKLWCHVIGTADTAAAANKRVGIQLALNGVPIPESECNVTITATGIGKLHSMYLFELDEDDEVTMWFANKTNQQTVTIERARMTLIGVR